MPKSAHATPTEKIDGYLNAGQVSLYIAARLAEDGDKALARKINGIIAKIQELR